jgi:hypothetical protein
MYPFCPTCIDRGIIILVMNCARGEMSALEECALGRWGAWLDCRKRRPVSAAKICRKVFLVVISAEENSIPPNKYLN